MRQMQSVLWTKGTLLNPQHLQTQDRYLEDSLTFRTSALSPYPWGFTELVFDEDAIIDGSLAVARGRGLFPDGLAFDFPGSDEAPPPKPLAQHWRPDQSEMAVYLAVPRHRQEGRNVTDMPTEVGARFAPKVVRRRDENTGLAERDIVVARKNIRILLEGESQDGSTVLPVGRVLRTGEGEVRLDRSFIPPLIDISASSGLLETGRRLVELLSARSDGLSGLRREQGPGQAQFGAYDILNFWLLYTVNSFLPLVRHHCGGGQRDGEHGGAHPAELFRTMSELAAALMTFSGARHPRELPTYDHLAPETGFQQLDHLIRNLLETVVPSNAVTLRLLPTDRSIYVVDLDDARHRAATHAFLAVQADMPQHELIERAPDWVKPASREGVRSLVNQATRGIELDHVERAPSALPVKLGYQYFRLDLRHPEWGEVVRQRAFAAWVAAPIPDPLIELVLMLPPEDD